jgi:peptidoglycan/LPS O-acetylase OafA/YrhL
MTARRPKLEGFDGLRALAACTVLTYHVALWSGYGAVGRLKPFFWELKGGVAVFFVITGALLYLPYARAIRDRRALPDWRGYAHRRVLRIVPAYWVVLSLFVAGPFTAVITTSLWRYYGLSEIYKPGAASTGLPVAWSLCVEVSFYALLPLFAALAARLVRSRGHRGAVRLQLALVAVMGLGSLALRLAVAGSLTSPVLHAGATLMVSLLGLLDWFAIGMALAVLRTELEAGRAVDSAVAALGRRPWLCVLLAFALFMSGVPFQHGDIFLPRYGFTTHALIGLGSGLLVLPVIVPGPPGHTRWTLRILRHPRVVWMGMISYGIYLWHVPVLDLVGRGLSSNPGAAPLGTVALTWATVTVGAVIMGAASWYLVERPFQRVLGPRSTGANASAARGRPAEVDVAVQS